MHNAPPVDCPVGRCAVQGWLTVAVGAVLAGLAADRLVWWFHHREAADGHGPWLLAVGTLAWCLAAWRSWRRPPEGLLRWLPDPTGSPGPDWVWCHGGTAVPCQVLGVLDLGSIWLVRVIGDVGAGVPRWLWLSAARDPQAWPDVRRAVWASRGNPDAVDRSVIFPRA